MPLSFLCPWLPCEQRRNISGYFFFRPTNPRPKKQEKRECVPATTQAMQREKGKEFPSQSTQGYVSYLVGKQGKVRQVRHIMFRCRLYFPATRVISTCCQKCHCLAYYYLESFQASRYISRSDTILHSSDVATKTCMHSMQYQSN